MAHVIGRLKPLYLAGELGFKRFGVTQRNIVNPGLAGDQLFPGAGGIQAKGTDNTNPRNYNSSIIVNRFYLLVWDF